MLHPKILIAEEEPQRAQSLQASLESAGFQVFHATDTTSAWKIIRAQSLVLALIDANLPGLSRCNLLLYLRADPSLAKLPVVILGEPTASDQAVKWLNLGADAYIGRSISSQLLMAYLHAQLRRSYPPDG